MSIQFFNEAAFGGFPQIQRLNTTDSLAIVLTAGWLNSPISEGFVTSPNNMLLITYGIGGSQGVNFFTASISNGVWTLAVGDVNVVLPVVSGDFAVFSGTSGAIADLGYLPSNAAKTRVVMANGATVNGNLAKFVDTTGTAADTGIPANTVLVNGNRASASNSTISVAAGAANHCTVTIALKDAAGVSITTVQQFALYSSDSSTGIGITGTAASTGYSMTSGGGVAALTGSITKNLFCVSSASGGAVVDLLDTGKTAYRIVLVLGDGIVVSAAATYG